MSLRFSKVLVTGGAGFIGSHVVDRLGLEGVEVGVLDNFRTDTRTSLSQRKNVRVHHGDVSNLELVTSIVGDYEAIVHEAALIGNPPTTDLSDIHSSNVTGTVNLLKVSVASNVQCFIYASSAAVYGETDILPTREDDPAKPQSPYAFSKLEGEKYCRFFNAVYGLRTICLRYFNVYGSRQKPGPYGGVISTFVHSLAKGEPLIIFGDGNQTRDFVHINDVVEANLLALHNNSQPGEVFNISTGKPTSINQLAVKLCELTGRTNTKPVYAPARVGDIRHSYGDFSKAREALGYSPRVQLEDGLRELTAEVRLPEQVGATPHLHEPPSPTSSPR